MKTRISLEQALILIPQLPDPWREICGLQLLTGARVSEISMITLECLKPGDGKILVEISEHQTPQGVWHPKTASGTRTVGFDPNELAGICQEATELLCTASAHNLATSIASGRWKPVQGEPGPFSYVFWPGRPTTIRPLNNYLSRLCAKLGFPHASSHDFRRVRIVQALASGADPNLVAHSVGHRNLWSTLVYLRGVPVRADLPSLGAVSDGSRANAWKPMTCGGKR